MKLKRFLGLIAALFLIVAAMGQVPDYVPSEYSDQYLKQKEFLDQKRDEGFITFDPIEQTPMESFSSILNGGNWAWDYYEIEALRNWVKNNLKRKVVVLDFDTGGRLDHPALKDYIWNEKGRSFTGEPSLLDGNGHSTGVASCIAGVHPSGLNLGIASIIPSTNLKIIPIKVMHNGGYGSSSQINEGGFWAANELVPELTADDWFVIANFSLGADSDSPIFNAMIKALEDAGVLVFGASGNSSKDQISIPAKGPNIHAIGAIQSDGNLAYFSNKGKELYTVAPGYRVFVAWKDGTYKDLSGTSFSSPLQAAIAAIIAATSEANNSQISYFLRHNATPGPDGWNSSYGYGSTFPKDLIKDNPERFPDTGNGNPDTPNPDPDEEPTCNDGKKNGSEEGVDCGGDCPPCEVEEPDDPKKNKRNLLIDLTVKYPVLWKPFGSGKFRQGYVEFDVSYNTDLYAEDAVDAIHLANAAFFTKRAFVLMPDDDLADMGYWVRHFYEMIMKKKGFKVKMTHIHAIDGMQRRVMIDKARRTLPNMAKIYFNPELSSFQGNIN